MSKNQFSCPNNNNKTVLTLHFLYSIEETTAEEQRGPYPPKNEWKNRVKDHKWGPPPKICSLIPERITNLQEQICAKLRLHNPTNLEPPCGHWGIPSRVDNTSHLYTFCVKVLCAPYIRVDKSWICIGQRVPQSFWTIPFGIAFSLPSAPVQQGPVRLQVPAVKLGEPRRSMQCSCGAGPAPLPSTHLQK